MNQIFPVKDTFNLEGFLISCYNVGVKLYASEGEAADGHIERGQGYLNVVFNEYSELKMAVVAATIPLFDDGQPSPAKVPTSVTPRQIRLALLTKNIPLASIDAAIDTLPEPDKSMTRVSWDYAVTIDRKDPMIAGMGALLGLTDAQIDELFVLAETFL
jgi:hypothetical protein